MKKFSFVLAILILGLFSCSNNDQLLEQEHAVEQITSELFVAKYSEEIFGLKYNEFVQLHKEVQSLALKTMPATKRIELWEEKLNQSKELNFLTENQISFIEKMSSYLDPGFQDKLDKEKIQDLYNNNWDKEGFNAQLSNNIFEELNPLNEKGNLITFTTSNAATSEVFDLLNNNSIQTRSGDCPTIDQGGDGLLCSLFRCSDVTANGGTCFSTHHCTGQCKAQDCGLFNWFVCRFACVPR